MPFYFERFESRVPPPPLVHSPIREAVWQLLASFNLGLGVWYLWWRWTASLNPDALWFAIPLVIAETCAFIGLALFTFNLWKVQDTPRQPPPSRIADCVDDASIPDRPLCVDVFFPSYNEDPELVRLSIRDAKAMTYPHPIDIRIHVLDDGKRASMEAVAREEGVGYITRSTNIGFKAGNMRNGLEQTSGDFIVICDADTRPFPTMLANMLGYFRDPKVAWVQSPHWFFDIPEGTPLREKWGVVGRAIEAIVGEVRVGYDPFGNDSKMFFDIILRRRNWANASFCCGAASVHRREAIMRAALRQFADVVAATADKHVQDVADAGLRADLAAAIAHGTALETEVVPFKFHVSEDIYTSIVLHEDREGGWKSVLHPWVESKMLSPQDIQSWVVQRFKYAGGTLDIALHDNPVFRRGMTWKQKLMYGTTFWGHLGCIWNMVFLFAPIVYLTTGIAPVAAYSVDFYKHALPFIFCTELAFMIGTWGVSSFAGRNAYLSFFPINLRALWTVLQGKKIAFPATPKDRQEGNFFHLVYWQAAVIVVNLLALAFGYARYASGAPYQLGGLLANTFWALNSVLAMSGIVRAAFWKPDYEDELVEA